MMPARIKKQENDIHFIFSKLTKQSPNKIVIELYTIKW